MNKGIRLAVAVASVLLVVACNRDSIFKGFDRTETGAYMRFYEKHPEGDMPRIGDGVTFELSQIFSDTVIFTTAGSGPIELELKPGDFVGDVSDALQAMHVGDSARLVVQSDSVFINMMQMDVPEEYLGKPIYYDIKLLSIKPLEVIAAERKAMLDSLRMAEQDYLLALQADPKNTITESGLIILEQKGKGKLVKMGDYIKFDFMLRNMAGDTLINSFAMEPIDIQYGEEFICQGIHEAMGMIPEGGEMSFIVPSELGFDSIGYGSYIKPYDPLMVRLRMIEITDQADHDAEIERIKALEAERIEQYLKDNDITVEPTETGLYIIPIEAGEGEVAKWGDVVNVYYTLSKLDGELLESGYDHDEPTTFTIGQGEMIHAIEDAVMTMAPGAKVKIVTPSSQAFGDIKLGDELPAYTPLVIELELVSIEE